MNVKPFRVRTQWFFVIERRLQGPFAYKQEAEELFNKAEEVVRVAKALEAVNKRRKH
jgi:hypothetical protein